MTSVEHDLKIKVGGGDWRPLRVRQFEVTETQPDGDIPDWLKMGNMEPEVTNKISGVECDAEEPADRMEEVALAHEEGGKHAFVPVEEPNQQDEEDDLAELQEDDEDCPDWIQCLKGMRFMTLTQALKVPAAMQIRA